MTVLRFDSTGRLGKVKRTPQGGVEAPASLTRVGILEYKNPDGSIRREYRDPVEVFDPESMASLRGAPITNMHPRVMVDPVTFKDVTVGNLVSEARQDSDKLVADLAIQDGYTIELIEKGNRNEISCGYACILDATPGVTPQGERYDARQTKIRYNHVALVPRGRAGRDVALRLDADMNQIPEGTEEKNMQKVERIDGVEYEVDSDPHKDAVKRRDKAEGERSARLSKLESENKELAQRLDGFKEKIEEAVSMRVALLERARKAGVKVELTASAEDVSMAIAAKVLPNVDLTGKTIEFIEGAIAFAETQAQAEQSDDSGNALEVRKDISESRNDAASGDGLAPSERARKNMVKGLRTQGSK